MSSEEYIFGQAVTCDPSLCAFLGPSQIDNRVTVDRVSLQGPSASGRSKRTMLDMLYTIRRYILRNRVRKTHPSEPRTDAVTLMDEQTRVLYKPKARVLYSGYGAEKVKQDIASREPRADGPNGGQLSRRS